MAMNWMGGKRKRLEVVQSSTEKVTRQFFEMQKRLGENTPDNSRYSQSDSQKSERGTYSRDLMSFSDGLSKRKTEKEGFKMTGMEANTFKARNNVCNVNRIAKANQDGSTLDSQLVYSSAKCSQGEGKQSFSLITELALIKDSLADIKKMLTVLVEERASEEASPILDDSINNEKSATNVDSASQEKTILFPDISNWNVKKRKVEKRTPLQPSDTMYYEKTPLEVIE